MTLLSANSILRDPRFRVDFTYTTDSGSYDNSTGLWEGTTSAQIDAFGSIQPVEREELHQLMVRVNGGQSIREAILIITETELSVGKLGDTSFNGSKVQHRNLNWLVVEVENYSINGHIEAYAVRVDGQND